RWSRGSSARRYSVTASARGACGQANVASIANPSASTARDPASAPAHASPSAVTAIPLVTMSRRSSSDAPRRSARDSRAAKTSPARLGTDYVDVYYLHVLDHRTPIEESLDAMHEILRANKARYWGISNYASWQILEMNHLADARGMPRPVVAQQIYNVLIRQLD